jgi:hypothetical protein
MVRINLTKITLNTAKMKQIANMAQSPAIQFKLRNEAELIYKKAKPHIPYNVQSDGVHLRDKYYITKVTKVRSKIQGVSYPSSRVKVKPKGKFLKYYGVVQTGNMNGKEIKYSDSSATPYAFNNAINERRNLFRKEITNILLKEAGIINE